MVARNASVTVATVMGVWAALLEDASHDDHRGVATRGEDFYAAILDLETQVLQSILEQMEGINLIACCMNDKVEITRWKERQYETDSTDPTNADRQRRFREKQKEKQKENAVVTDRNGRVTAMKRPDTDTDTDTEAERKKETREVALLPPDGFSEFWELWPNKVGKPAALKAFRSALKRGGAPAEILAGVLNYIRDKPPDRPWLNPATFLNQNRWEDQPAQVQNGKVSSISSACDNLVHLVNAGFGGPTSQDGIRGGADEADARLLPYRGRQ